MVGLWRLRGLMRGALRDARFAALALRRDPLFVALSAGSLGLALGVVTSVYGVLDAATHPVSAVRRAEQVVLVGNEGMGASRAYNSRVFGDIVRDRQRVFETTAALHIEQSAYTLGTESFHGFVLSVSPEFFTTTGIVQTAGRTFVPADFAAAAAPVAMLSFRIWRKVLGAQRDAIGRTIEVDGRIYTIVGIMPPDATWRLGSDVVLPGQGHAAGMSSTIGRLRSGMAVDAALEQLRRDIDPMLTATFGVGRKPFRTTVAAIAILPEAMTDLHKMLLAASALIVLIASANLANLMLARGIRRRGEFALRFSLGARRSSIIRQTLLEAFICALVAAALGVVLALWFFDLLTYGLTRDVPGLGVVAVSLNWRVFAFVVMTAVAAALVFGLYPALRASSVQLNRTLKDASSAVTRRSHLRYSPLVIAQMALTLALLMGGNLLVRSARELQQRELGFEPRGLFSVAVWMPRAVRDSVDIPQLSASLHEAFARENTVRSVATLRHRVPEGYAISATMGSGGTRRSYLSHYMEVSASYLSTLGVRLVRGRDLEPGDAQADVGSAVISRTAAIQFFRNEDPLGQMLTLADVGKPGRVLRVVGIAEDVVADVTSQSEPGPALYVIAPDSSSTLNFIVRTAGANQNASEAELLRRARSALPPGMSPRVIRYVANLEAHGATLYFVAGTVVALAAFALALALFGMFSVRAHDVAQRRREFAVGISLGATQSEIMRSVLRESTVLVLAGTAIGAFLAMYAGRYIDALLYGVFYTDVYALLLSELLLVTTALIASLAPALRAARTNPVDILRAS